jgi:hypothetical protein
LAYLRDAADAAFFRVLKGAGALKKDIDLVYRIKN